jgi:hypothetical protein
MPRSARVPPESENTKAQSRTLTATKAQPARKRETLALMRGIADAAARRDAKEVSRRCATFVERSAAFALQVLSAEPAAGPPPRG